MKHNFVLIILLLFVGFSAEAQNPWRSYTVPLQVTGDTTYTADFVVEAAILRQPSNLVTLDMIRLLIDDEREVEAITVNLVDTLKSVKIKEVSLQNGSARISASFDFSLSGEIVLEDTFQLQNDWIYQTNNNEMSLIYNAPFQRWQFSLEMAGFGSDLDHIIEVTRKGSN